MSAFEPGPGFYTVGFTLGTDGGALAVLRRKHVRVAPDPKPIPRGAYIPQKTLEEAERAAWQAHFDLIHVEQFASDRARSEVVKRVRALVSQSPLDGESTLIVDLSDLGQTLREPFYMSIGHQNYCTSITLTRETTRTPSGAIPMADVCGAVIALLESKRLKAADEIPHKNEVGRVLELVARGDDLSRIALAVAVACYWAKPYVARGPWAGRQRPKPATRDAHELESWTMLQRELRRIREDQEEGRWWPR